VARILIVGCGGRGQALARELVAQGHAVRGTTRDPARAAAIQAAGAEPYLGDPDRIATLMDALAGVTVLAWLMGTADGPEVHGTRLRMLFEKLVDTTVRGVLYEAAGPLPADRYVTGSTIARRAQATWAIPLEVLTTDPGECERWRSDAAKAVARLL